MTNQVVAPTFSKGARPFQVKDLVNLPVGWRGNAMRVALIISHHGPDALAAMCRRGNSMRKISRFHLAVALPLQLILLFVLLNLDSIVQVAAG